MTEQEVKVFGERLKRIWKPTTPFAIALSEESTQPNRVVVWHLRAMLDSEFQLGIYTNDEVYANEWADIPFIRLDHQNTNTRTPDLILCTDYVREVDEKVQIEDFEDGGSPLVVHWLPLFRRGCWLSGCPIEASAHEKAEWMQGFSREELETWNLKF